MTVTGQSIDTILTNMQEDAGKIASTGVPMDKQVVWEAIQKLAELVEGLCQVVKFTRVEEGFQRVSMNDGPGYIVPGTS